MGLDFSHGDAHWGYIGFGLFRQALAKHEGIDLNQMEGFPPMEQMMTGRGDWVGQPWDTVTTPLKPLLDHSDCDGELSPEECRQIAPRLREVIDALWPEGKLEWHQARERERGLALADAMDLAAEMDEPLEFY